MNLAKISSNINISVTDSNQVLNMQNMSSLNNNQNIDTEVDSEKIINKRELQSAVDKANKVLFKNNTHLQFQIHERTKDVMVKIIDDETGEVLKEIPPEKILDMVAKLWEVCGIFVDEKR